MRKVGIVTMCGGDNYGNALQNFAVQSLITRFGFEAITLNNQTKVGFPNAATPETSLMKKLTPRYISAYRRTQLTSSYGCKNDRELHGAGLRTAKRELDAFLAAQQRRHEKFDLFRAEKLKIDTIPMNCQHFNREHLSDFDAFVCGSDQIWNPNFHQNSMLDFLQFAPQNKRIAFAPSFGVTQIPALRREEYARWLKELPSLSVREKAGTDIIRDLTGREAVVLLDPTFGLSETDWAAFERKPASAPAGRYIFCYFLGNRCRKYGKWIERFAREAQCEIVDILDIHDLSHYDVDPCEFVWLLHHAEAVFTDSFHGVAFSINLERPFVAFERVEGGSSMSSRITSVLEKAGLSDRLFPEVSIENVQTLSFKKARQAIAKERASMCAYLGNALKNVGEEIVPLLAERRRCTGCAACYNACPAGAISMQRDEEGFLYPKVDNDRCLHCNACANACPQDRTVCEKEPPKILYAFSKDAQISRSSSSGGIFPLLAAAIVEKGGVVFGAGFDERFRVCHRKITQSGEIPLLRTSKYVQSEIGTTFRAVKAELSAGKTVLFTGTPCQVSALRQYLGSELENLYTQDIICHGVPSPGSWELYLEQCHGEKDICGISFRDKTFGWNRFAMRIAYADGTSYCVPATKDPFERAFLANLNLRPACYRCQYKTLNHASDITLGDYWGVELVHPELKDRQGVSLLLVHTEKGQALLDMLSSQLQIGSTDGERAIKFNHAALHSVKWPKHRDDFFSALETERLDRTVERCLKVKTSQKISRVLRNCARKAAHLLGIKRRKKQ